MLGMLINTNMPWARNNTWRLWVDHIMKYKSAFGFKKASLIHANGVTAAATQGFMLNPADVHRMKVVFELGPAAEKISIGGKTYIIKQSEPDRIIAFNGSKYFIITKSKSMYIVAMLDSKTKCEDAANLLRKLNTRLIEKDF